MSSKLRLWTCSCCLTSWSRRKKDQEPKFYCPQCGPFTIVAKRTFPKRRACRHARVRSMKKAFYDRYCTVPRTKGMRKVRAISATRKAWNAVRAAKTRASLLRRLNAFIEIFTMYHREDQPRTNEWGRMFGGKPTRFFCEKTVRIVKQFGGLQGFPPVVFQRLPTGTFGIYVNRLLVRSIQIDPSQRRTGFASDLDALRSTFVHELQHYIDDELMVADCNHDRYFQRRLSALEEIFPSCGDADRRRARKVVFGGTDGMNDNQTAA
jgi:predicted RNA-binding Zn-ribbon protein involved in translation (DUF1610 family)